MSIPLFRPPRNKFLVDNVVVRSIVTHAYVAPQKSGLFYAGTNLCCLVWCYFRLPETKDRTFGEIDLLFENHVPARKFKSTKVDRTLLPARHCIEEMLTFVFPQSLRTAPSSRPRRIRRARVRQPMWTRALRLRGSELRRCLMIVWLQVEYWKCSPRILGERSASWDTQHLLLFCRPYSFLMAVSLCSLQAVSQVRRHRIEIEYIHSSLACT